MSTAYIALGANLGNRAENLRMALRGLTRMARVEAVSSLYETEPEVPPQPRPARPEVSKDEAAEPRAAQPKYYNAVARITTGLAPESLLRFLKSLEHEIGRRPTAAEKAPRPIDLDLLLYDDVTMETPELTLPHPRMAGRAFVIAPLAEIAPELEVAGETAGAIAAELGSAGVSVVAEAGWDGVVETEQDVRL